MYLKIAGTYNLLASALTKTLENEELFLRQVLKFCNKFHFWFDSIDISGLLHESFAKLQSNSNNSNYFLYDSIDHWFRLAVCYRIFRI